MMLPLAASAIREIDRISKYVSHVSPARALSLSARFDAVFETTCDFPSNVRATNRGGMRDVNTHPYLIFYKPPPTFVEVLAIRHGARNSRSMPARPS